MHIASIRQIQVIRFCACIALIVLVSKSVQDFKNSESITVPVEDPTLSSVPFFDSTYRISRRAPLPLRQFLSSNSCVKRRLESLQIKLANKSLRKAWKLLCFTNRFCKLCQVSWNDKKTFYHHYSNPAHRTRPENRKNPYLCIACSKPFESQGRLLRHAKKAAQQKVVINPN